MQITIENVVNQFRALSDSTVLSQDTMRQVVEAVMEAIRQENQHCERVAEEGSLRNYQQRNRPWER